MPCLPPILRAVLLAAAGVFVGCSHPTGSGPSSASATPSAPPVPATAGLPSAVPGANASRNAFVLISGGGSPLSNNYSQYVQAKAVADYFDQNCPPESTWVFFGAGNREGAPPVLADARRESNRDGLMVQSWVPGILKRNRAASRENILRALRDEILPMVRGGGTLFLFIGDHGELTGKDAAEQSAVTLWQLKRSRRRPADWVTDNRELLTVADLRAALAEGLGRGRVVFCMTQCHSGGFHELGLARDVSAPREWFAAAPQPTSDGPWRLKLLVAGFTATDQASVAAGCVADPDPEHWVGYERFIPEALLGRDLLSGQPKARPRDSFAGAHEAATLVDQTIDKPRATSEYYLEAWARVIETDLAKTLNVTPRVQAAVAAYQRAVDTGRLDADNPALRERAEQFARFTRQLAAQLPSAGELLVTGTRAQLEAGGRARGERGGGRGGRRTSLTELRKLWSDTLRPAWKAALLAGRVRGLDRAVVEFEKHLLELEDEGRNFLLPRGSNDTPLLNEIYWQSGYADPAKVDLARAEKIARWGAERRARIVAWASLSAQDAVRAAAEKIGPGPVLADEPPPTLSRRTAVDRVLFYRRVLAAWEFLLAVDAKPALADLARLIDTERTPLLPPST
jgi:hypothetical protein